MIEKTRVALEPSAPRVASAARDPLGLTQMELSKRALDADFKGSFRQTQEAKRVSDEERVRTETAHRLKMKERRRARARAKYQKQKAERSKGEPT